VSDDPPPFPPQKVIAIEAHASARSTARAILHAYRSLADVPEQHPYFNLIGRVAAEWAQFEHILDLTIWWLVDKHNNRLMACLTAQIQGAQSKCYAIIAILQERGLPNELVKSVRDILKETHSPQSARNRIVHDPWFAEPSENLVGRHKKMARDELRFGIEPVNAADIEKTITEIRVLQTKANELRSSVCAALVP
jgi:hypothetical protein